MACTSDTMSSIRSPFLSSPWPYVSLVEINKKLQAQSCVCQIYGIWKEETKWVNWLPLFTHSKVLTGVIFFLLIVDLTHYAILCEMDEKALSFQTLLGQANNLFL